MGQGLLNSETLPSSHHYLGIIVCSSKNLMPLPVGPMQKRLFLRKADPVRRQKRLSALRIFVCVGGKPSKNAPAMLKSFCKISGTPFHRWVGVRARESIFYLANQMPSSHSREIFLGLIYFLRKEQPSVSLALPPVGWQSTVEQPAQMTTVWAWEKTVVMVKQPGHLTSMKNDRGAGTRV